MVQRDGLRGQCHNSNPKAAAGCTSWPGTGCAPAEPALPSNEPEATEPPVQHHANSGNKSSMKTETYGETVYDGCKQKQPLTHLWMLYTVIQPSISWKVSTCFFHLYRFYHFWVTTRKTGSGSKIWTVWGDTWCDLEMWRALSSSKISSRAAKWGNTYRQHMALQEYPKDLLIMR